MAKKEESKDALENVEVLQEKFISIEHWIETNPKIVFGILGALVLVVGGYFGYGYYKDSQNAQAQKEMFQAIRYFEKYIETDNDSLNLALKGDGNNLGLVDIVNDYSITDAANLANFYAGVIYMKQGNYELARLYLEDFSSSDLLVQARAYSLIGDANMEQKKYDEAARYYSKAADYKPNKFFSPIYLMKLALAYEKLEQSDKAIKTYQRVIDEYFDSSEVQNAKRYKARLEKNS
ncbi:MAG: tetratricopeptide repeat protein [Cyclobacteriaceae bacterium]